MGLKNLLCLVFLPTALLLHGQDALKNKDTIPYKSTFPDKITFRMGVQNAANRFVLRNEDGSSVRYRPVSKNILKLSAQFRGLDIGFGVTPAFINPERDQENARLRNMNFRLFLGRLMQTFDYYDQRGYFGQLEGDEVYLPGLES